MTLRGFLRNLAVIVTLTAVYFATAKLGLELAYVHPSATVVWPPAGIAFAALLVFGYRVWPGIFLGAYLANITTAGSVATCIGIAAGNTLEGLVGVYLVNRFANGLHVFDRQEDVLKFTFLAAILSTTVSATFGVISLSLGGYADWGSYGPIWLTWWLGDASGDLIVAPLLVHWSTRSRTRWDRRKLIEAGLFLLSLVLVIQIFFGDLPPFIQYKNYPLAFLCIPILVWAALRLGPRETATGTFLVSGMAIFGTLQGFGPFVRETPQESLLLLQAFMGVIAVMAMVLAAGVSERNRAEEELRQKEQELEQRVHVRTAELVKASEALRASEETLAALYEANLKVQEPWELSERLKGLVRAAETVLDLDRVNILLADPEGRWLEAAASLGTEEPLEAIRVPIGPEGGGIAQAYLTQQMITWDGRGPVPEEFRLKPPYDQIAALRSRVFANVPLIVGGKAIGVLGADRKHSRRPFDPATLQPLQLFATQAALAIANAQLYEELAAQRDRLRALMAGIFGVKEEEAKRIAHALHDEAGQLLATVHLALEEFAGELPASARAPIENIRGHLHRIEDQLRRLSHELRPTILDDLGLQPALHFLAQGVSTRTDIPVTVEGSTGGRLSPSVETAIYRIVQEALANVTKHALATHVRIELQREADMIRCGVRDDGVGFDVLATLAQRGKPGLGLLGIRERLDALGGKCSIRSAPGRGTELLITIPIKV